MFGAPQLGRVMRRCCCEMTGSDGSWPAAAAQMQAGADCGGEAGIAGNDQGDFSGAAEYGDLGGEGLAAGDPVVTEDNAAKAFRQGGDGGQRVGQALRVGEQPEHRQFAAAALLYRASPSQ